MTSLAYSWSRIWVEMQPWPVQATAAARASLVALDTTTLNCEYLVVDYKAVSSSAVKVLRKRERSLIIVEDSEFQDLETTGRDRPR